MLRITLATLIVVVPVLAASADAAGRITSAPPSGRVKTNNACGATPQLDNCRLRKTRA
jgi:hypothetical protein